MEHNGYKSYHRGYQNINELYDDLKDSVLNISLNNGKITVVYHSETLEIERAASGGYDSYHNGKRGSAAWDDQDLYPYVLAFVHEQRKDITELEIYDTQIRKLHTGGFTYLDDLGREHHVEYAAAAQNYGQKNGQGTHCVGERDIAQGYIAFYPYAVGLKVLFKHLFVLSKKRCLTGARTARFTALQKHIAENGYSSYDMT